MKKSQLSLGENPESKTLGFRTIRARFGRPWKMLALPTAALAGFAAPLRAGNVYVPNFSFESPNIGTNSPYAAPVLEDWQETPQPNWYDPADFGGSPGRISSGRFTICRITPIPPARTRRSSITALGRRRRFCLAFPRWASFSN